MVLNLNNFEAIVATCKFYYLKCQTSLLCLSNEQLIYHQNYSETKLLFRAEELDISNKGIKFMQTVKGKLIKFQSTHTIFTNIHCFVLVVIKFQL